MPLAWRSFTLASRGTDAPRCKQPAAQQHPLGSVMKSANPDSETLLILVVGDGLARGIPSPHPRRHPPISVHQRKRRYATETPTVLLQVPKEE